MARQLSLISDREWQLDDRTREIARVGLASARAALAAAAQAQAAGRGEHHGPETPGATEHRAGRSAA